MDIKGMVSVMSIYKYIQSKEDINLFNYTQPIWVEFPIMTQNLEI